MLVLTRHIGESIIVGDNVQIIVTGIGHNQVRIGVVAPRDVLVDRQEVRERRIANPRPGDDRCR